MQKIRVEQDLNRLLRDMRGAAVVLSWAETGLFEILATSPRSLEQLPGDPRSLEVTSAILVSMNLLERQGNVIALTEDASALWASGALRGASATASLGDLSRLPGVLREGGPVQDEAGAGRGTKIGVREDDPAGVRAFMEMLDRRSRGSARFTAGAIDDRIRSNGIILDLGGGHGRYAQELVERGHSAVLFDLAPCVEIAREKHGESLAYRVGDFFVDDLGGPYDAILLSNIVHGLGEDANERLLRRVAETLAPGGVVVLKDMFLDSVGGGPDNAVVFGLTMLMHTDEGRSYGVREMAAIGERIGLEISGIEFSSADQFSLLFLSKD